MAAFIVKLLFSLSPTLLFRSRESFFFYLLRIYERCESVTGYKGHPRKHEDQVFSALHVLETASLDVAVEK